jgi:hypothetical protein
MGKPEGKRPLGTPRLRWEDSIKMNVREIGTIKKTRKPLFDATEEIYLEANAEKTKLRQQNAGQSHDMKIANIL